MSDNNESLEELSQQSFLLQSNLTQNDLVNQGDISNQSQSLIMMQREHSKKQAEEFQPYKMMQEEKKYANNQMQTTTMPLKGYGTMQGTTMTITKASEQMVPASPMLLNFDYSSIFDNKEALHSNSLMSGAQGSAPISSRQNPNIQKNNMDDSFLSNQSPNAVDGKFTVTDFDAQTQHQQFKSQGIKQLLSQVPDTSKLAFNYDQILNSKQQSSNADILIEQSRKRIQDITELMKPPAEMMNNIIQSKIAISSTSCHQQSTTMSQNGAAFRASSEYLVEKNVTIQKSTKVMETELRSLQDKIQDLECKLNVTTSNSTSAATNQSKPLFNSRTQINLNNDRDSSPSTSPLKPQVSSHRPHSILSNDHLIKHSAMKMNQNSLEPSTERHNLRVKIKDTPEYLHNQRSPSTQSQQVEGQKNAAGKKKIRVDIDLIRGTHHVQGEENHGGKATAAVAANNSKMAKREYSPQVKLNGRGSGGLKRQESAKELSNSKQTSGGQHTKLNTSISSINSKTKDYLKRRPSTSRPSYDSASVTSITRPKQQQQSPSTSKLIKPKLQQPRANTRPLQDITNKVVNHQPSSTSHDEAVQSNYKEIASKVVDLQRQLMSLRGKLKMKEQVEEENEKLKAEVSELRNKGIEAEKKKTKYKGEVKELQAVVGSLQKENKELKSEIAEIVMNGKTKGAKKSVSGKISAKK